MLIFNSKGLLDPGDYELTIEEIRQSLLVVGPDDSDMMWDAQWRLHLVNQLEIVVNQLWAVGIHQIYIDGSFVEEKSHPNDIDGYFVCDLGYLATGELQNDLNKLDPHKVWTWDPKSRRSFHGYTKRQLPMWHKYRVELYPHFGQPSGIMDQYGNELQFPSAFRTTRETFLQKGIIKIVK